MKFFLVLLVLLCAVSGASVYAAEVTLAWTYNKADEAAINGYKLYYRDIADKDTVYEQVINDPAARETTVHDLTDGATYEFWLTAFFKKVKSEPSNMVAHKIGADNLPDIEPLTAPSGLTLK